MHGGRFYWRHPICHEPNCEQIRKFVQVFFDELDEEQKKILQYNLENDQNVADLKRQILVIMAKNYDSLSKLPHMGGTRLTHPAQ